MIKAIKQVDKYNFEILWSDGITMRYRLSTLQRNCPCSKCRDLDSESISDMVLATRVKSVGNYGLKVSFTSGCSRGIYTFEILKKLGERK